MNATRFWLTCVVFFFLTLATVNVAKVFGACSTGCQLCTVQTDWVFCSQSGNAGVVYVFADKVFIKSGCSSVGSGAAANAASVTATIYTNGGATPLCDCVVNNTFWSPREGGIGDPQFPQNNVDVFQDCTGQ
jgi:hypothetical protein